ncbi:aminoglycoside phosphotransferase family protein [Caenimonas sedimenti]|uniref:Aminoglycoside phosphotransferase family protein n=1 Tax=Caenimonas sedimenti TaxID=2596921 RepID=A0A562ZT37_9BURK|nr:aminoglycoside phosphotransferase family protein [Caenimonas sedimenti]TWO71760.1 aminoglycoside phosphotransferase family protein [Caenimonas sedimenti]
MHDGLRAALAASHPAWAETALQPLPDRGLAHLHVRLAGTGVLARLPKQSQLGLAPEANLAHERACFERAAPSGHTPRLLGWFPVSRDLPRGGLLVEEIVGRPPVLPDDLPSIARALAALHALPLPPASGRSPLAHVHDPLQDLLAEVTAQARHVPQACLVHSVAAAVEDELRALRALIQAPDRPTRHLIAFDAHPGNFLLHADGRAVLVDLEKCRYGYPGLDLAHATLYTSTTWDAATQAVLSADDVLAFHAAWDEAVGPVMAEAARPWHLHLRRAMWLWSITWCCKWRVLSGRPPGGPGAGEDWSSAHSDDALVAHVRERVDHYLSPAAVARVRDEFQALARAWSA